MSEQCAGAVVYVYSAMSATVSLIDNDWHRWIKNSMVPTGWQSCRRYN